MVGIGLARPVELRLPRLEARNQAWSGQGIRVLAVASRTLETQPSYSRELERDLDFVGFLSRMVGQKNTHHSYADLQESNPLRGSPDDAPSDLDLDKNECKRRQAGNEATA